ncbi:prepilin-type N-terminal cleavage/methylation domain-containing protein [Pontiellaceae bacterium B12219]|nr:prepilin-type N-terminal cleavage/methylation domain-containing protein [Pontiellaceae bacterium B12219]
MCKTVSSENRNGFTLAELLVVIAIMGALFLIALPALTHITGQTKLEAAANALHSAAKTARQYAVANGQPAYLVLNSGETDSALAYRAYAVFTINIHTPVISATNGYFIKGWEALPSGIVLDPLNGTENIFDRGSDDWQGGLNSNNQLKIDGATYVVCGFSPNGEASSASQQIHLAEGAIVGGQPNIYTPGNGKQIHFSTQGKSKIRDTRYDEAGELKILGDPDA